MFCRGIINYSSCIMHGHDQLLESTCERMFLKSGPPGPTVESNTWTTLYIRSKDVLETVSVSKLSVTLNPSLAKTVACWKICQCVGAGSRVDDRVIRSAQNAGGDPSMGGHGVRCRGGRRPKEPTRSERRGTKANGNKIVTPCRGATDRVVISRGGVSLA